MTQTMAAAVWVVAGRCAGGANAVANSDLHLCCVGRLKPSTFTPLGRPTSFVIANAQSLRWPMCRGNQCLVTFR